MKEINVKKMLGVLGILLSISGIVLVIITTKNENSNCDETIYGICFNCSKINNSIFSLCYIYHGSKTCRNVIVDCQSDDICFLRYLDKGG